MTSERPPLDPRLTAARPDLAAASLRGLVEAARFVDGTRHTVVADVLDMKRHPRADASLDTQLLHGETVIVYDEKDGWAWVQAERDDYVGYVALSGLARGVAPGGHRIIVARTFVYPAADMKAPVVAALPMGAVIAVEDDCGFFLKTPRGYVVADHCASNDMPARDRVAVAERLEGVPYLWGGRSPGGIDCSGLLQLSHALGNVALPRDTYRQEQVGRAVPIERDLAGLRRGDLVFWRGHVGIMLDAATLLHANAHHMLVAREPLAVVRDRIASASGASLSSIRRLDVP